MFSVVIPVYNREKTIKRAIDSVLAQTYDDFECIVVDDCSSDKSAEIIKAYKDKRIKYIKLEKNSGACAARNKGIVMAKGKYIAFQDSDDYWEKDKLAMQLKNLEAKGADLDFCKMRVIDEGTGATTVRPNEGEIKTVMQQGVLSALCNGNFISTQAIIGKAECFKECMFDEKMPRLQDFDLCLRLSERYRWSFTDKELVKILVQADSISKNNEKMIKAASLIIEKKYKISDEERRRLHAHMYKDLGDVYWGMKKGKEARDYYKKSLAERHSLKVLVKRLLAMRWRR